MPTQLDLDLQVDPPPAHVSNCSCAPIDLSCDTAISSDTAIFYDKTMSSYTAIFSDTVISSNTAMEATTSDQKAKASESFPLRRLPLELRRKIYEHNLTATRYPSPEATYRTKRLFPPRDHRSPLLQVDGQVRAEVLDLVKIWPIPLRVTHQGIRFSSMAETCFIAQRCSRDYGSIGHLVVEIWPPHPDRPTDAIDIWRHLRKLRAELLAASRLQRISFIFADNKIASWTHNGKPLDLLNSGGDFYIPQPWINDIIIIAELFARISVERTAFFRPPRGLKPGETTEDVRNGLRTVSAMMMGRIPIDEGAYSEENEAEDEVGYQDWLDEDAEARLQRKGAEIARDKLDVMTRHGSWRLSRIEWDFFMEAWWPHFERLTPEGFKGEQHYVAEEDPYGSY